MFVILAQDTYSRISGLRWLTTRLKKCFSAENYSITKDSMMNKTDTSKIAKKYAILWLPKKWFSEYEQKL